MKRPTSGYDLDPHVAAEERVEDGTASAAHYLLLAEAEAAASAEDLARSEAAVSEWQANDATDKATTALVACFEKAIRPRLITRVGSCKRRLRDLQRGRGPTRRPRCFERQSVPRRSSSSSRTAGTDPGDEDGEDEPADGGICVSIGCNQPIADNSRGPKAVYCDDPACRRRDERRRKELEALALDAWDRWQPEAESELLRASRQESEASTNPSEDASTYWGRQRRREGLHVADSIRDDQGEIVVGFGTIGTRRGDLQFEMERDGDGQVLGCEKKKARRESYEDLQAAARLESQGKPPLPGKSYTRWRYSERAAQQSIAVGSCATVVNLATIRPLRPAAGFARAPWSGGSLRKAVAA